MTDTYFFFLFETFEDLEVCHFGELLGDSRLVCLLVLEKLLHEHFLLEVIVFLLEDIIARLKSSLLQLASRGRCFRYRFISLRYFFFFGRYFAFK